MIPLNNKNSKFTENMLESYKKLFTHDIFLTWFPSEISSGLKIKREQNFINRILDDGKDISESCLAMQRSFNIYNFYAHYAIQGLEDEKLALENISIASSYAKASLEIIERYNSHIEFEAFNQEQLFFTLSTLIIVGLKDEAKRYSEFIINDIEKIVEIEDNILNPNLWFILKLLNNEFETSFQYITHPYDKYNDYKLDIFIYLLLEVKIENIQEENKNLHIVYNMFPYEALVYMKIKDLNLNEFNHPLLDSKIVKTYFNSNLKEIKKVDNIEKIFEKLSQI